MQDLVLTKGEVIRLDDRVTRFDDNKTGRPNCVVAVIGDPIELVYVVPRTTRGTTGTFVPAGVLPGLDKPGRFLFVPRQVLPQDLVDVERLGILAGRDR
jgi:hypothetical protein